MDYSRAEVRESKKGYSNIVNYVGRNIKDNVAYAVSVLMVWFELRLLQYLIAVTI